MIRLAQVKDLEVLNSMLSSFNVTITEENITNHPFTRYLLNEQKDMIVGFLSYSNLYENYEIEYLYTKEEKRNRGFAHELVSYLIKEATDNNCQNITLEVRVSNLKAITLYKSFGFTGSTVRSKYYEGEDALLMVKKIGD